MKRRLQTHGPASHSLVLPKKWLDRYEVKGGDELEVEELGPKLVISTEKTTSHPERIIVDQATFEPHEDRVLGKLYVAGYDVVELRITNPSRIPWVKKKVLENTVGFEVVEESEEKIVFQCMTADQEDQYKEIEKKEFITALETSRRFITALETKNKDLLQGISELDDLTTKFSVFCERYLNKKSPKNYAFNYIVLWGLEKIGDEYKYLAQHVLDQGTFPEKDIIVYAQKVSQYLEGLFAAYYRFDMKTFSTMFKQKEQLLKEGYEMALKASGTEAFMITQLRQIVRVIFDLLASVLGTQKL